MLLGSCYRGVGAGKGENNLPLGVQPERQGRSEEGNERCLWVGLLKRNVGEKLGTSLGIYRK